MQIGLPAASPRDRIPTHTCKYLKSLSEAQRASAQEWRERHRGEKASKPSKQRKMRRPTPCKGFPSITWRIAATARGAVFTEVVLARRSTTSQHELALGVKDFLSRQLGAAHIHVYTVTCLPELSVSLQDWASPQIDILGFDRLFAKVSADGPFRLLLRCNDWKRGRHAALQVLTRYQRLGPLAPQLPQHSLDEAVTVVQELWGSATDRSALDRSLDRWRWVLRLNPLATRSVQLAALFWDAHDGAPDAATGAVQTLRRGLQHARIEQAELRRASELLLLRGAGDLDLESATLRDADTLAFFNVDSWRHLRQHGEAATLAEARRRLASTSPSLRVLVKTTRQPTPVDELLRQLPPPPVFPARQNPGWGTWAW
jgi:hypothetical protein